MKTLYLKKIFILTILLMVIMWGIIVNNSSNVFAQSCIPIPKQAKGYTIVGAGYGLINYSNQSYKFYKTNYNQSSTQGCGIYYGDAQCIGPTYKQLFVCPAGSELLLTGSKHDYSTEKDVLFFSCIELVEE